MSDLVERVARLICCPEGIACSKPCSSHYFETTAIAAITVVLEEAAKTVDQMPLTHPGNAAETALECAAAIRAMKGTE